MKLNAKWVFSWAALRLPSLALVVYLFRYQLVAWFEGSIGFLGRMDFFVFTASTFSTRFLLYLVFTIGLGFWFWLTGMIKLSTWSKYLVSLTMACIGIYISFVYLFVASDAIARTAAVVLLLSLNTLPHTWLTKLIKPESWAGLIYLVAIGIVEIFFPQSYILWLMNLGQAKDTKKKWGWLSGIFIAPLLWIFLLVPYDNHRVFTLTEILHADPAVEKITPELYNWVEINQEYGLLYAVGRGTNFLLAFDVEHLEQPPKRSHEDIGKTQSFGFNPNLQEIYVYKSDTKELLYMDALTLDVLRSVSVSNLSPGDVWIKWVPLNDTIIISSEADAEIGTPLYVLNRESGEIIAMMDFPLIPTAYLITHPSKPLMYFNSFKDPYFAVWNMENYEIAGQVEITPRTDRMVFFEKNNEVWIASPLEGSILRYDADTLESKGFIKSSLGDRTLNIDTKRNLLLTGNFMSGRLTVIDLATEKKLASYYLGPWIRTIALDTENGIAYVSTVRGLFKVNYTAALK